MRQLVLELAPPPEPSLENFVAAENASAVAALRAAVTGDAHLFLFGPSGSGKTHLARAFSALRPDALVIEDAHLLDAAAQARAFDDINRIRARGGALLATADRPPAALPLREDLRTRFAAGTSLALVALSDADKRAALERYARERGLQDAGAIIDHLLTRRARDLRSQVSIIDALDRASLEAGRPLTLRLARELLKDLPT